MTKDKISEEERNAKGIVKVTSDGIEYTVWTYADTVKPHIINKLKEMFIDTPIIEEFDKIDICIPRENLPIEIQSTPISKQHIVYSQWEDRIRRQIEENIENYDKCWFFFDSELLKAMMRGTGKSSVNLIWFRQLIKNEKLKVFTVNYDGTIEEKEYKDFDFLSQTSQMCPIGYDNDDRILNRNKIKILNSVLEGYNFTQEEIEGFRNEWKNNMKNGREDFKVYCGRQENNERIKLYKDVLYALCSISNMNKLLNMTKVNTPKEISERRSAKSELSALGVFQIKGIGAASTTKFIDKFNICKYFPGYIRNKEKWESLKGYTFCSDQSKSNLPSFNSIFNDSENEKESDKQAKLEF